LNDERHLASVVALHGESTCKIYTFTLYCFRDTMYKFSGKSVTRPERQACTLYESQTGRANAACCTRGGALKSHK